MSGQGQRGATLLVALIVVLVLAILASTALQSNFLQSRLVANQQNQEKAFQAAEAGLLAAEKWIESQSRQPETVTFSEWTSGSSARVINSLKNQNYLMSALKVAKGLPEWEKRSHSVKELSTKTGTPSQIPGAPKITIELIEIIPDDLGASNNYLEAPGLDRFRQTSLSKGESGDSEVILQTEYQKRFR